MGKIHIMSTKTLITRIITALLCLLFQTSSFAGVYKWVDEKGQVHYGERPANADAERITIRQNETTKPRIIKKAEAEDAEGKTSEDESAETPATEPAKPEPPKISKKEKRQRCNEAKSDIASISSRGRMREINKKGEYAYLSEQQRQQRLSAARKKQREFCR